MKIYGIDPWESEENSRKNPADKRTENSSSQKRQEQYFKESYDRLSPYPNYKFIREYSIDAANRFDDESLDFVYIDANHQPEFVVSDIDCWSKKVRKGGIVAGHDYYDTIPTKNGQFLVKTTINKYVKKHGISPLIIWGLRQSLPGMYRDKWRSWMWVKI